MKRIELEKAGVRLIEFMHRMCDWEIKTFESYKRENGGPEKNSALARANLLGIYNDYLTPRERKTGRLAGPSAELPPEYDPSTESFVSTEAAGGSKAVVSTRWAHPEIKDFWEDRRYTMVLRGDNWLLDKKEIFSVHKGEWIDQTL